MGKRKIIICDDDKIMVELLGTAIEKEFLVNGVETAIEKFSSIRALLKQTDLDSVDVFFLDIDMPEMNGIDLAERIQKRVDGKIIVFVSGWKEYVFQALRTHPFAFVRKENFQEDIRCSVHDIAGIFEKQEQKTLIRIEDDQGYMHQFLLDTFCYAEAQNKYVRMVSENGEKLIRISMKNIEKSLEPYENLVRCHRSYIVNLKKIYVIEHEQVEMLDHTHIPVRRGIVVDLKKRLCSLLLQK